MNAGHAHTLATRLITARASQGVLTLDECQALAPESREDAYAIQSVVWQRTRGSLRPQAWKIGNSTDGPAPVRAAMPCIVENGGSLSAAGFRLLGIEAEIAVCFARDLPARAQPWRREEILAAIGSAHLAIEIVDTALQDPAAAGPFWRLADSMLHGSFVLGEALQGWRDFRWQGLTMQSFIDGVCCAESTGGHPHVDPLALLPWWVNQGSCEWAGVRAGDIVTTGTWNGMHFADQLGRMHACLRDADGQVLANTNVGFTT